MRDSLRLLLSIFRRLVYLHYFYLDGICQPNTLQIISSRFKLVQARTHNQTSSRCWHSRIERELESILSLIASTFSGQRALSFDRQRVQIVVLNVVESLHFASPLLTSESQSRLYIVLRRVKLLITKSSGMHLHAAPHCDVKRHSVRWNSSLYSF